MDKRHSNIELLRIFAMFFIIMHHLLVHGMNLWEDVAWSNLPIFSLDSMFFVGVNVFVLISGYCQIKFSWCKLVRLYLLVAIFGGLCYSIHLVVDGAHFGRSVIYYTLLGISHAPWYISTYIYLFLLSPLINAGLANMNKSQILYTLAAFTYISVYFGWFMGDIVNPSGYGLFNFVWIYVLGFCIKSFVDLTCIPRYLLLLLWGILSILNAVLYIADQSFNAWSYNNPFVVISAVALFWFFLTLDFSSRLINILAASTLGIYLFHENTYISQYIYGDLSDIYSGKIGLFLVFTIALYSIGSMLDAAVRYCFVNPLAEKIVGKFSVLKCKADAPH